MVDPGMRIDPAAIAVAASTRQVKAQSIQEARVPVSPPGTRLFPLPLGPAGVQIRNFQLLLVGRTNFRCGGQPEALRCAGRTRGRVCGEILRSNLLLLSGGVSHGKVPRPGRASIVRTGCAISIHQRCYSAPGKPTVFGKSKMWCGQSARAGAGHLRHSREINLSTVGDTLNHSHKFDCGRRSL